MTNLHAATATLVLSIALVGGAEPGDCRLPAADSREGASPPNLDGTIVELREDCLDVESGRQSVATPRVCLGSESHIFTAYGGHVGPDALRDGQRVHVWLEGCRPPDAARPSAVAVVEVASLNPGEDFRE